MSENVVVAGVLGNGEEINNGAGDDADAGIVVVFPDVLLRLHSYARGWCIYPTIVAVTYSR